MNISTLIDKLVNLEQEIHWSEDPNVIVSGPSGESGDIQKVYLDFNSDGKMYVAIDA